MQITCYYVTSLSCNHCTTNSQILSMNTQPTSSSCVLTIFSLGTLDTNKVRLFIAGLVPGTVQCLRILFSLLVSYFKKLSKCSLLCKCSFESPNEQSTWMSIWIVTLLAYMSKIISVLTAVTFIRMKNKVTRQYVLLLTPIRLSTSHPHQQCHILLHYKMCLVAFCLTDSSNLASLCTNDNRK
jgi:hypothetical protein